ncbi:MAG TPA: transposase [Candidatus Bipolaricaulota bacterium]
MLMQVKESVIIQVVQPTRRKAQWLEQTAKTFSDAVQLGLEMAEQERTSSRNRLHKAVYRPARKLGLPADYARMAVNAAVALARSYVGLMKKGKRRSFPKVNNSQGIGLGTNAYTLQRNGDRSVLRVSTGKRGQYVWLPLCVPSKFRDRLSLVQGDAKLFQRNGQWYAMLPVRITPTPTVRDGEPTFIGVDLGIVRHATAALPDRVVCFNGKPSRHKREHFADLRKRYGRHKRMDRIKRSKGKEARWMRDQNHKLSYQLVDLAAQYPNPVLVFERLDGIRQRTKGSKRFNRMMSSWAFRQLVGFVRYKAERMSIPVVFIDPRKTSQSCSRCGHTARSNRTKQANFRCVSCGYCNNADANAAFNITALGPSALEQGPSDTARLAKSQTQARKAAPDVVPDLAVSLHGQTTTSLGSRGTPALSGWGGCQSYFSR